MGIAPGHYTDLSDKDYHADHAISSSSLVHALRSPAHFWANYVGNPNRVEQEDTKALRYGRAIHKFLLENGQFANAYIIAPKLDKRTKEGKAAWADLETRAVLEGSSIITADEADLITKMSDALRDFQLADDAGRILPFADIFSKGTPEESFFWKDPTTGLMLRARTDWRVGPVIIDYKTTQDARPYMFRSEVVKRRYYMRAAMYMDGVEAVTGKRPDDFYFIAQEKSAPYCAAAYRIRDEDLKLGRVQYQDALINIKACMDSGKWAGYSSLIETISVPDYLYEEVQ